MTLSEACAFLGVADPDDAFDAFEEAVFTLRQQLIAGPVLLKTTESRIKRLQQLEAAYSVIAQQEISAASVVCELPVLPQELFERFTAYHAFKNKLRASLAKTLVVAEINALAACLLELERALVLPFEGHESWGEAPVAVGKEPDPMPVLHWLREQQQLGHTTVADLQKNQNNLPVELVSALKRLSLLKKYLYP